MRADSRDLSACSTADDTEREPDLDDLDLTRYNFNEEAANGALGMQDDHCYLFSKINKLAMVLELQITLHHGSILCHH